jgi:hypothetical protein
MGGSLAPGPWLWSWRGTLVWGVSASASALRGEVMVRYQVGFAPVWVIDRHLQRSGRLDAEAPLRCKPVPCWEGEVLRTVDGGDSMLCLLIFMVLTASQTTYRLKMLTKWS